MAKFARADDKRSLIWAHLVVHPGLTAHEIARAALRGNRSSAAGICERMKADGQLMSSREYRPQQGREVTLWYATPGAFPIAREG